VFFVQAEDGIRDLVRSRGLGDVYKRQVPRQFVDHFAKNGVDSLGLGFADEDELAVMFCDIRGFTSLSEQMSPQQLMNFLNAYFLRMNAPIHDNNGFIDKFIGDAIMALFDHPNGSSADKASDALKASLDLQKALKLYNYHRSKSGYHTVKNGIGLHLGQVVIGTVGSDDRMDTTVLGDAVNIAQRIEALTNYFGLDILASKTFIEQASINTEFAYRSIDKVMLRGKSSNIEIFEIYEHLSEAEKAQRNLTTDLIEEGISMRNARNIRGALNMFNEARLLYPDDPVFVHHVKTCEQLLYERNWDGNIRI